MNLRSPSIIRRHPGFVIRDHDWTINGPMIGPEQRPHDPWPGEQRTPTDHRRERHDEWPPEDRRTPRVPDDDMDDLPMPGIPHIVPSQPTTCWLI
ncbi:hypothetical protein [Fulvimonas yonginensis]|uniref:Uncharacterized protein n=1 Tax=Fulvimonas yonginensis TaxID=1495200 RepID=A0ABU8JE29_9GAMM